MSKKMAKSPEMVAKEALVRELEKKVKRAQTTLKTLKTKLNNNKQEFIDFQIQIETTLIRKLSEVVELLKKLAQYAEELSKAKYVSTPDKGVLKDMAETFKAENFLGSDFQEFEAERERREKNESIYDEEAKAKAKGIFDEFHIAPPQKEQREIRKVFIGLSSKFHPDKAKNDAEREHFHALMQEINEAYQNHDIHKLLELELLNSSHESLAVRSKAITIDVLTAEVERLTRELNFLENQIERTSGEIKGFRQSDIGNILTKANKAAKDGVGINEQIVEFDRLINSLTPLCNALEDSLKNKKMSSQFYVEILKSSQRISADDDLDDEDMDEFEALKMMLEEGGLGDMMSEGIALEEIDNLKFQIGTAVQVAVNINAVFYESVNYKGLTGVVVNAFRQMGQDLYIVEFDIPSLRKLPEAYFYEAAHYLPSFDQQGFAPQQLKKVNLRKIETIADVQFRQELELKCSMELEDAPANLVKIIIEVIADGSQLSDCEKWSLFLNELDVPISTKTLGRIVGVRKGKKMLVMETTDEYPDLGLVANYKVGHRILEHPLMDLKPDSSVDERTRTALEAYHLWFDEMY